MIIFKTHQALDYIQKYLSNNPVIIEAGAFDGKDTLRLAEKWPNATIHAFEPVPAIFEQLKKNTEHIKNIHRYSIALSSQTGTATFYVAEKPHKPGKINQAGALHKPKERLKHSPIEFPRTIKVQTITLDDWAMQNNIDHVDMLWLDLQGYELPVMQAAPKILNTVNVIFTEVAFIEAYEGQPQYKDVKNWLENNDFTMIGKDFEDPPQWFFGNALFVKK